MDNEKNIQEVNDIQEVSGNGLLSNASKSEALKTAKPYKGIPIAAAGAILAYLLVRHFIPAEHIIWWWREIWSLLVSLVVLKAISSAMEIETKLSTPTFLFSLALFSFFIFDGFEQNEAKAINSPANPQVVVGKKKAEKKKIRDLVEGLNTFLLDKKGDDTGWLRFPDEGAWDYNIVSPDRAYYTMFYGDSKKYNSHDPLPYKNVTLIRIFALTNNELITIRVERPKK